MGHLVENDVDTLHEERNSQWMLYRIYRWMHNGCISYWISSFTYIWFVLHFFLLLICCFNTWKVKYLICRKWETTLCLRHWWLSIDDCKDTKDMYNFIHTSKDRSWMHIWLILRSVTNIWRVCFRGGPLYNLGNSCI